jgi:hypothetical protein
LKNLFKGRVAGSAADVHAWSLAPRATCVPHIIAVLPSAARAVSPIASASFRCFSSDEQRDRAVKMVFEIRERDGKGMGSWPGADQGGHAHVQGEGLRATAR